MKTPNLANMTLPEKVIEQITLSNVALEKAASIEQRAATKQASVDALIPKVVDALVDNDRIHPNEREKAASMLRDPVQALNLLMSCAQHHVGNDGGRLGSPLQKEAAAKPQAPGRSPFVGVRGQHSEASDRLLAGLGLPVNS